ncbi:AI-2E family transporter [Roseomonas cutis]|uniref:AI-2E family transporter n=1 Tax=Roseomonas cutis TaxID=2897332 RepID=UPI002729ED60|nr:AI-2E family transporter [Roseomonas sp. OT10]
MAPFDPRRPALTTSALVAPASGTLVNGAIVVAAIYFGRDLFVPLVLAVLLAFVLAPLVRLFRSLRLPGAPAVLIAVLLAFAIILGIGAAVGRQVGLLAENLPAYQATMRAKLDSVRMGGQMLERANATLRDLGQALNRGGEEAERPARRPATVIEGTGPDTSALGLLGSIVTPLLGPLATTGVVIVFTVFVLLYRENLRDRLVRLAGSRDLPRTTLAMNDAAYRLSRFFLSQVGVNACFGIAIALGLWAIGLPNPPLWGILAGLMRFVPFLGNPIALAPMLLLALAVDPGWSLALQVLALYAVCGLLMSQLVEPLLYSQSTGLSPISVILSATFWTFMWGPIGLLLATPLTVCLVVLGRHVDRLEFLDVMLGDRPPLRPEETFYQRALEGDADGLVEQAKRRLRDTPLATYYDEVALRGLVLAQADMTREALEGERLEAMHQQIETLLDDLAHRDLPLPAVARPAALTGELPPGWRREDAVVCVAGRSRFDDLGAGMAAQVLQRHGFGARAEPNAVLGAHLERLDPTTVRLCCLCVLEEGNSAASIRYFLRRIRRQLPDATVIIALWHTDADSPMLQALRAEGQNETVVSTLREMAGLAQALALQSERERSRAPEEPAA